MGHREGKEAHENEKVQRAKGRWDGMGVSGVRARGALPGEARAPHGTLLPGALRRFDESSQENEPRADIRKLTNLGNWEL